MTIWTETSAELAVYLTAAGRSPQTVKLTLHYIRQLQRFPHPSTVTTDDLLGLLARSGWGPDARKNARSSWRTYFAWAIPRGHATHNPAAGLPTIRVPDATPRPAPESAIRKTLVHADPRIPFMVLLGAECGLRCAEIAQVHGDDYAEGLLTVHGKGGYRRAVPVASHALAAKLAALDGWAFPGKVDGHLSPATVSKLLGRALPGRWTAHTLRHRCGSTAIEETGNLLAVAALLGHKKVETTRRYCALPSVQVWDAARAAVL